MGALELDKLTWTEIREELFAGRDTVVMAFGATEQHGPHMALATDALLGDHLARLVADELDAFVAPTVRFGCSSHHLAFAGTLSLADATFHGIVADVVASLARGGFRRVILLPTHGGNFAPLAAAVAQLPDEPGIEVVAMTDLGVLFQLAQLGEDEHNVPLGQGGVHGGEWETSMMLAIHPDLVHTDAAEPGYTGDLAKAIEGLFESGIDAVSPNGVIGDPVPATAEHGERYWQKALEIALAEIEGGD